MSVQSFRNVFLNISGQRIYAYSIDFNTSADVDAHFNREKQYSTIFRAKNPIKNTLKISYPLTGYDHIKSYINSDESQISGSFAGYNFSGAKLKNYNFNIAANSAIVVNAELNFWGPFTGIFATQSFAPPSLEILDGSNVSFDANIGDFSTSNDAINDLSYNYEAELEPDIRSQQEIPNDIRVLRKTVNVNFKTDSTNLLLPISGERINFNINLRNQALQTLNSYLINGAVTQKQTSVNSNALIETQYGITQHIIQDSPVITFFTPAAYYYGKVVISGDNLRNISAISFNNVIQPLFINSGSNTILATVPNTALSGKFGVYTDEQKYISLGTFNVLDSGINPTYIYPVSGSYYNSGYNKINISGDGFFNISAVRFGVMNSPSFSINAAGTLIQAVIPESANYGKITVLSDSRNKVGTGIQQFVPIPNPQYYQIATDSLNYNIGSHILCPSGYIKLIGQNFGAVTGVKVNNIPASFSNYTISTYSPNSEYINIRIPSGATRGQFSLLCHSGVVVNSNFNFQPSVYVSGVGTSKVNIGPIYSGLTGSTVYIKLKYKMDEIMSQPTSKQYYVTMGNFITGNQNRSIFYQLEPSGDPDIPYYITGLLPVSGNDGTVKIWLDNGSYSENTGVKVSYIKSPEVYYVDNNILTGNHVVSGKNITYLGENVVVIGQNLQYITGIQYKLFDPLGDPFFDNLTAPTANGPYPYWSGFRVLNNGTRLVLPTTGTLFNRPAYGFGFPYSGISGAFAGGLAKFAPSSAILMSPYGNVPLQQFFTQEYTGVNNIIYPYYRNKFFIGDYRYAVPSTGGIISPTNAGQVITSLSYLYRSGYLGINDWRFVFSGFTGIPHSEFDFPNGFCTGSGLQVRREYLNQTPFGYGCSFTFEGKSGWNWYATGTYSQTAAYRSPWSGAAGQYNAGWGLSRTVYFKPAAYTPVPYIYLGISGNKLSSGNNTFRYTVYGDDGYYAYLTGTVVGY